MKLSGKTALITGAATGIGREIARLYAQEGASLCLNYHNNVAAATALKEELETKYQTDVILFQGDVSDEETVKTMVDTVLEHFGKLDILVCSHGINNQSSVENMTSEQWDHMILHNLRTIFLCDHYCLIPMLKQNYGRIINVTSQIGQIGGIDSAHYSAAKAGIIGFTKSLAREVSKRGVTANCIAPGPIATPFLFDNTSDSWRDEKLASLPLGRFGEAYEVAPSALLLAADPDGNIFTGQTLGPNSGDVML